MSERPTVLVVEDNAITRKLLRVTLEAEGYVVIEAPDARVALASARRGLPDLVLQDLVLPDADGFELARQLRALPDGERLPIVAVSGFVGRIDDAHREKTGFTALLVKPVEPARLVECVQYLLPRSVKRRGAGHGLRLLLVEHDAAELKLIAAHLAKQGFELAEASSAGQALRVAVQRPPHVIVSKLVLPETDGFALCAAVRRDRALAGVPVVLLSEDSESEVEWELAKRVGASSLVVRTPELEELVPAILKACAEGPPSPSEELTDAARLEHARAVIRQLERKVATGAAVARRCTLQAAQLSLLGGIADALSGQTDTKVVLHDVLAATLDAAAISKGALYLRESCGRLVLRDAIGFSDAERAKLDRFFGEEQLLERILAEKVPVSIPSPAVPERSSDAVLTAAGIGTAEIVPLLAEGKPVGAIVLGARRTDATNEESVFFARAIGNQIVQSLELERSFRRLSESERRYRAVLENAHDAIWVSTPDGTIREVNGRAVELLGLPRGDIVGRTLAEFRAKSDSSERSESGRPVLAGRSPPVELRRSDGSHLFVEFSIAAMDVGGEELVVTVGRDVTDELRAQTQLFISDRMASIGMLAAGVAHEINNPLAAVVANLDLAVRDIETLKAQLAASTVLEELAGELADAREAAFRVRNIVRDLKIFSRADQEPRAVVDVHRVLESATRMAWNEIRHRAQLVKEFGAIPKVSANESRLGQVFLNLIVNAAQAIPEGHADNNQIAIRTGTSRDGGSVIVQISDTGSGIAPEVLQKLFTPFFTTKPQGVGTGLGLTICHRLVTELGGEISVESEVGRGTTFRVTLPASAVQSEVASAIRRSSPGGRRGRILVVDDEALVGGAVRRALLSDHDVIYLSSAEEALGRISGGERFDVILCDLMMPVMTGMELFARLAARAPEQAERMAFLTGGAFTPAAREFLEASPNPVLEKPFDVHTLETFIRERLR
jgi:PAS domain S-box-containing protein